MRSAAFRHVPTIAWKSPCRSRMPRMLAKIRSSAASLGRPRSTMRIGGIRTPSWKISVAPPDRLPGLMPPTSPQCARTTGKTKSSCAPPAPGAKSGVIIATSFRCVPPVYGSLCRKTSPGWMSSPNFSRTARIDQPMGTMCSGWSWPLDMATIWDWPSMRTQEKSSPS